MGNVVLGRKVKREKARIDPNTGDVIDPKTGDLIEKNDPGYMPTKQELESAMATAGRPSTPMTPEEIEATAKALRSGKPIPSAPPAPVSVPPSPPSSGNPLAGVIKKQVQDAVAEAMKEIDIAKMVKEAIQEAFKTQ